MNIQSTKGTSIPKFREYAAKVHDKVKSDKSNPARDAAANAVQGSIDKVELSVQQFGQVTASGEEPGLLNIGQRALEKAEDHLDLSSMGRTAVAGGALMIAGGFAAFLGYAMTGNSTLQAASTASTLLGSAVFAGGLVHSQTQVEKANEVNSMAKEIVAWERVMSQGQEQQAPALVSA